MSGREGPLEILLGFFCFFGFFGPRCTACGILVPRPGIEPKPPALAAQSLNHWTAREVLIGFLRARWGNEGPGRSKQLAQSPLGK